MTGSCPFLRAINTSMFSIGPGRYNAFVATTSSKELGANRRKTFLMPSDSNWKIPLVSPCWNNASVLGSSNGIECGSNGCPVCCPTSFTILARIPKLRNPKKSIFSRPSSSTLPIGNCVSSISSPPLCNATVSVNGAWLNTIPAACVE